MKHYCNRRMPKQTIKRAAMQPDNNEPVNALSEEIPLPPGGEYIIPETNTEPYLPDEPGQGGAYIQSYGYNRQNNIYFDNMSGKFDIMSVPQNRNIMSSRPMSQFLDRYIGKYICLDLWTADCRREEMCGILTETGTDFLVLDTTEDSRLTMIDLRSIRYISIYCR